MPKKDLEGEEERSVYLGEEEREANSMARSEGAGVLRLARNGSSELLQRRRRLDVLVPVELLQRKTEGKFRGMPQMEGRGWRLREGSGLTRLAGNRRTRRRPAALRRAMATAWGQEGVGKMRGNGEEVVGASYSPEAGQGRKGIAGINCGGTISGGRDFWAEEEGKMTSRTRQPSVLTGGPRV